MSFKTVLIGAQYFRYTTKSGTVLDLHGVLTSWSDNLRIRMVSHEYVKRDGGECEPCGAAPGRWVFRCVFLGADVSLQYQNLRAVIYKEPRGKLTHPRLGSINVGCDGIQSNENPETAINALEFQISFVEDQVDTALINDIDVGFAKRAAQVTEAVSAATDAVNLINSNRIANAVYAALQAAQVDYANAADKFQARAVETAQSTQPDPALEKFLGSVLAKQDAVLAALDATLPLTLEPDVSLTPARTAVYVVYASCLQLFGAVIALKPPIVQFTVPTAMPLTVILTRIYGRDAQQKMDEVFLLNRIPLPHWVPAGTVLSVVAPVVRQ